MKTLIKSIIILAVVGLLLFLAFQDVNFSEVKKTLTDINPLYAFAFLIVAFLQYVVRAYRWRLILKPHKKNISFSTLYNYTAIGFLLNILPGRVGEAARGILVARKESINKSTGLASVVLERLIDMVIMVLYFLISLLFIKSSSSAFLTQLRTVSFYLLPLTIFALVMFYLLNIPTVFKWVERIILFFTKRLPIKYRQTVSDFSLDFLKGLKLKLSVADFIRLFISSSLVWLTIVFAYWLLMLGFKDFGMNVSYIETIPYTSILGIFAAIPTPGMSGTFEAGSKMGLTKLYGVSPDTAIAYTVLAHFLVTIIWILPGVIAFWMEGLSIDTIKNIKKEKATSQETQNDKTQSGEISEKGVEK